MNTLQFQPDTPLEKRIREILIHVLPPESTLHTVHAVTGEMVDCVDLWLMQHEMPEPQSRASNLRTRFLKDEPIRVEVPGPEKQ